MMQTKTLVTAAAALLLGSLCLPAEAQQLPKGAMNKAQSEAAVRQIVQERNERLRRELESEWKAREYTNGEYRMKFWDTVYGPDTPPAGGRSMIISMHGGGQTSPQMNDGQWNNQKRLYRPSEALYFVPRSPTDTWNMWHQEYMDELLRKAIAAAVLFDDVNPDRIYITGYSAGGDGTYQMAPRMADHWGAAAMMAGHPGDAQAENLRNLPFAIFMGGQDAAYNRNGLAREWITKLDLLAIADHGGYVHTGHIFEEHGHGMMSKDSIGISWMARFTRDPYPRKVVWIQDDVVRDNFYWVGVPDAHRREGARTVVAIDGQTVDISESDSPVLLIGLNDRLVDLDKPVTVRWKGRVLGTARYKRTASSMLTPLNRSPWSLDEPYPVVLRIEQDGNARNGATVKQL